MITADILSDFMLGRVSGDRRRHIRDRLAVDPAARGALGRVRRTSDLLRARMGEIGEVPREWIELLESGAQRPMSPEDLARERTKTWL